MHCLSIFGLFGFGLQKNNFNIFFPKKLRKQGNVEEYLFFNLKDKI